MSNKKVGVGCLPLLILVIILSVIRFQLAPGKTWEKEFANITVLIYFIGVVYMLFVVIINKFNEPVKLSKEEGLVLSISKHKREIEKYLDSNGCYKMEYRAGQAEFLSHHLAELFNEERELSYCKSIGLTFKSYSFNKKTDHEQRRMMIEKIIKDNELKKFAFWGGLYRGQAYNLYHGIGECSSQGCYNQVDEVWHNLCYSCFRENNWDRKNVY
ncbi:hypothetical protein [Flavobacterium stagni]|uniref:Uncharacterized protein n=1 Tax=Flavobacterium stagni TaxID=2506421 RepID=A0A4Q1KCL4_9FLAO|nr:hypothetical protein [Flavobacterium stagni]RXR24677.1 hypothetical protein EQG61_04315 [Flavobacterium stagni]